MKRIKTRLRGCSSKIKLSEVKPRMVYFRGTTKEKVVLSKINHYKARALFRKKVCMYVSSNIKHTCSE